MRQPILFNILFKFVLIFLSFGALTSCTKSGDSTGSVSLTNKIKAIREIHTSNSTWNNWDYNYQFSYDANGKIISEIDASHPGNKYIWNYLSNGNFTLDLYDSNKLSIHELFYVSKTTPPHIDSTFQYNDTNDSSWETYTYNSFNKPSKLKRFFGGKYADSSITNYVYNASGDLITETEEGNTIKAYEYYADLTYSVAITVAPNFTYSGKLVKRLTQTIIGSTTPQYTADYTYSFDSQNRITMQKEVLSDGEVLTDYYTYY